MAPITFPDAFGANYEFNDKSYKPIMRQNSILTPTSNDTLAARNPQSTSPSTKKMSDSESKEDETYSQKKISVRESVHKPCGCDTDPSSSIAEDLSVATKTASYKKQPIDGISE